MSDDELVRIAKSVYQKHKRALDFIFEQRPDLQLELSELIGDLIKENSDLIQDRRVKSNINFVPKEWEDIAKFNTTPRSMWTKTGRTVMLEIRNGTASMYLCVVLGPTEDEEFRRNIFEYCRSNAPVFGKVSAKLSQQYFTLYSQKLLNRQQLEDGDLAELEPKVREAWGKFLEDDLKRICELFRERFGNETVVG